MTFDFIAGVAVGIGLCIAWYHGYGWWQDAKIEARRSGVDW